MASRLTVIFYIVLCMEAGLVLTIAPWVHPFGMGDWGNNYFLVMAAQKTGLMGLQHAVASGWVRGAVTGLGLLNLAMAFWELAHFNQTVRRLQGADAASRRLPPQNPPAQTPAADASAASEADHLSHHERQGR